MRSHGALEEYVSEKVTNWINMLYLNHKGATQPTPLA